MKIAAIVSTALPLALMCQAGSASDIAVRPNAASQEKEQVYETKDVAALPVVTYQAPPFYPFDAMHDGVQGGVQLDGVVSPSGRVSNVRVLRALRPDLDAEAVKCFEKWRFKPAQMKDGRPVAVRVSVEMNFSLSKGPDPVFEAGGKIAAPTVVTEVKPAYSDEDRAAGRTGEVALECVVRRNGIPTDIVVTRRLYPSLDEAAVAALKQWRFKPGARGRIDVSVRIQLTMSFDGR